MMDYENVKAVLLAVLKKWLEEQQATVMPTDANTAFFSYGQYQIAEQFSKQVLEQLKTSFDIMEESA